MPKRDCSEAATAYFCKIRICTRRESNEQDLGDSSLVRLIKPQVASGPGAFLCVACCSSPHTIWLMSGACLKTYRRNGHNGWHLASASEADALWVSPSGLHSRARLSNGVLLRWPRVKPRFAKRTRISALESSICPKPGSSCSAILLRTTTESLTAVNSGTCSETEMDRLRGNGNTYKILADFGCSVGFGPS